MMAERALTDTVFYEAALKDPKRYLPRLHAFTARSRIREHAELMTSEKRALLERRGVAFLTNAQQAHAKWNGSTWTRARHLFGILCLEERRSAFAKALLQCMGRESALPAASQPPSTADPAATTDPVDAAILQRLQACKADGTLAAEVALWKLDTPEMVAELVLLATAPPGSTEKAPVLCQARTPRLFERFIPMLFVGFAHNLYVESSVSKLANLEKIHPNLDALTLQEMLLYKARQEESKAARMAPSLRSQTGGGARKCAVAKAGKALEGGANDSKSQQLFLCSQVEARAKQYQTTQLLSRGDESVRAAICEARGRRDGDELGCHDRRVSSMAASCRVTGKGRKRKAPQTAAACDSLTVRVAEPFTKLPKLRGSRLKQTAVDKELKAGLAARRKQATTDGARARRKQPVQRTGKGERAAANRAQPRPPRAQTQQTRVQPPRAAGSAARAAVEAESEQESEPEDGPLESESEGEEEEGWDLPVWDDFSDDEEGDESEGSNGRAMEDAEGAREGAESDVFGAGNAAPPTAADAEMAAADPPQPNPPQPEPPLPAAPASSTAAPIAPAAQPPPQQQEMPQAAAVRPPQPLRVPLRVPLGSASHRPQVRPVPAPLITKGPPQRPGGAMRGGAKRGAAMVRASARGLP